MNLRRLSILKKKNKKINEKSLENNQKRFDVLDKRVTVTGTIPGLTRSDINYLIAKAGGIAQNAVTNKTDILITGLKPGQTKRRQAGLKGVDIIHYDECLSQLQYLATKRN